MEVVGITLPVFGMPRDENEPRIRRGELLCIRKKHEQRNKLSRRALHHHLLNAERAVILDANRLGVEWRAAYPLIADSPAEVLLERRTLFPKRGLVRNSAPFGVKREIAFNHGRLQRVHGVPRRINVNGERRSGHRHSGADQRPGNCIHLSNSFVECSDATSK